MTKPRRRQAGEGGISEYATKAGPRYLIKYGYTGQDEATERKTGRPRSVTPDFLHEVAKVWSEARAAGDPEPRTAVADHFGAAQSTAGRWITKARDAGLLAPSGRARKKKESKL